MNPHGPGNGHHVMTRRRAGKTPHGHPCCYACGIRYPEAPGVCLDCLRGAEIILRNGWWKPDDDSEWAWEWRPAIDATVVEPTLRKA